MRTKMKWISIAVLLTVSALAAAEECVQPGGVAKPADKLAWLQGYWTGELGGAALEEYFAPPKAGMGVGLFRLIGKDGEQVIEYSTLRDTADGIELRLRHFDIELKSMEPDDHPTVLRAKTTGKDCVLLENPFNGMPKYSLLQRTSAVAMRGKSDIVRADRSTASIEVAWQREGDDVPVARASGDLSKLTGHWRGEFDGGTFEQWWFAPKDGTIVGMMRFYQGDKTRMLELYTLKAEGKALKSYTWQLGPELVITSDHPKMLAEGSAKKSGLFVFNVHTEKLNAKSSLRLVGHDRMQQRVEIAGEKPIVMVIDLKRVGEDMGPKNKMTGEDK